MLSSFDTQKYSSSQGFLKNVAESLQSCLTVFNPMDCSPPGSSIHGIFQARIMEWVAISFFRVSIIVLKIITTPERFVFSFLGFISIFTSLIIMKMRNLKILFYVK